MMCNFPVLFTTLTLLLFASCTGPEQSVERSITPFYLTEDEAFSNLSGFLIGQPDSQQEQDQNLLINYAIDQKLDVQITSSGLIFQIIDQGEGPKLEWGNKIQVYYKGFTLPEERIIDSNWSKSSPMEFYIGNTIQGWNEGLQLVSNKAKILLLIPSQLAYGTEGFTNIVGPNQCLGFYIQVEEIVEE